MQCAKWICWLGVPVYGFSLSAAVLAPSNAHAQLVPSWHDEYTKRLKYAEMAKPLEGEFFGEQINLYDGTVSFAVTDVVVSGNSMLPVAIGRSFNASDPRNSLSFGDWELDVPMLSGVFGGDASSVASGYWAPAARCSTVDAPPAVEIPSKKGTVQVAFSAMDYWDGSRLSLPGRGGGELLGLGSDSRQPRPTGAETMHWTTKAGWYFSCLPSLKSGQPGEGFLAHAPDGARYSFDWMVVRPHGPAHKQDYGPDTHAVLNRNKVVLYPTQVTDRFGNWVRYEWTGNQLKRIYSNDGRQITLNYDAGSGRVASIATAGRQWLYGYDEVGQLASVTLPDQSHWSYAVSGSPYVMYKQPLVVDEPWTNYQERPLLCTTVGKIVDSERHVVVTHPSGAVGEFVFKPKRHGRMGVPFDCQESGADGTLASGWNRIPVFNDVMSLAVKRVSGPALVASSWSYDYSNLEGGYDVDTTKAGFPPYPMGAAAHKWVTVTDPIGRHYRYEYGKEVGFNDGLLLSSAVEKDGIAVRSEVQTYYAEADLPAAPFPEEAGRSFVYGADTLLATGIRPVRTTTITQDGVTFTRQVNMFDAFARPLNVHKSSSLGLGKTDATEYFDDRTRWVIGQLKREVNADSGEEVARTEYDANTALPLRTYAFGKLQQSVSYNADGTAARVNDGNGNVTTLSSWRRGIPQTIRYANGTTLGASVSDQGWISDITDENGYITYYGYDVMGRQSNLIYPSGDTTSWLSVTSAFQPVSVVEFGLPAGHWRHDRRHMSHYTQSYMDALWRPVLTVDFDNTVPGTSKRNQVVRRFDAVGRLVFESYPTRGSTSFEQKGLLGTHIAYDALDRVVERRQDSELGALLTWTEYLPGFLRRTTSPRQQSTTEHFQAYDAPSYDSPVRIDAPEGVSTIITRDRYGKPLEVTRAGPEG